MKPNQEEDNMTRIMSQYGMQQDTKVDPVLTGDEYVFMSMLQGNDGRVAAVRDQEMKDLNQMQYMQDNPDFTSWGMQKPDLQGAITPKNYPTGQNISGKGACGSGMIKQYPYAQYVNGAGRDGGFLPFLMPLLGSIGMPLIQKGISWLTDKLFAPKPNRMIGRKPQPQAPPQPEGEGISAPNASGLYAPNYRGSGSFDGGKIFHDWMHENAKEIAEFEDDLKNTRGKAFYKKLDGFLTHHMSNKILPKFGAPAGSERIMEIVRKNVGFPKHFREHVMKGRGEGVYKRDGKTEKKYSSTLKPILHYALHKIIKNPEQARGVYKRILKSPHWKDAEVVGKRFHEGGFSFGDIGNFFKGLIKKVLPTVTNVVSNSGMLDSLTNAAMNKFGDKLGMSQDTRKMIQNTILPNVKKVAGTLGQMGQDYFNNEEVNKQKALADLANQGSQMIPEVGQYAMNKLNVNPQVQKFVSENVIPMGQKVLSNFAASRLQQERPGIPVEMNKEQPDIPSEMYKEPPVNKRKKNKKKKRNTESVSTGKGKKNFTLKIL